MRRSLIIWSLALLPFAVAVNAQANPATPLNDDDCAAAWKEAGGADLKPDKAKPFIASFDQVDVDHDGAINWEEFKAGCKKGLVTK
ncbi:EF-hand domain-containing protein [Hyphomicrobium sp. 99]|uniref:EF-hand domain-containing protein n=1 Tax=Hyphomicrobium sp. 99 TaxID=1163419 RepID=UPI0005F81EA7|nr:EF-hand domain-containing protein [Hyphomicrobium sp. 99]